MRRPQILASGLLYALASGLSAAVPKDLIADRRPQAAPDYGPKGRRGKYAPDRNYSAPRLKTRAEYLASTTKAQRKRERAKGRR